jgi:tetratricopeptide (TPR) repeat protein
MRAAWFIVVFFFSISNRLSAQNSYADSLKSAIANYPQEDSIRVTTLNLLAFETHFSYPAQCIKYAQEARDLAEKINYRKGIALSYRYTGLAHWTQSQYSLALSFFFEGLKIADSLHYGQVRADIMGNIGLVQNGMGNYPVALQYLEKSLAAQRALKNIKREIIVLNSIGDSYFFLQQYDRAIATYKESLSKGQPINFLVETNHRNIGVVFDATNEFDSAMSHYNSSMEISNSLNEKREMSLLRKSIASTYLKKGNIASAQKFAQQSLTIAKEANYRSLIRDVYFLLSDISVRQGKTNESFAFFKLASAYKDSIQNLAEASKIAALEMEYEIQKKQMEIARLQKEGEVKKEELLRKNTLLISAILLLALIVLFLIFYIRSYRYQKSVSGLLKQQNQKMQSLNEEIRSQQEEVTSQRDVLAERNQSIESLNKTVTEINESLEKAVAHRTAALKEQNQRLEEYAFLNAHDLRGPVARILGIINLLEMNHLTDEKPLLLGYLKKSAIELDQITRSISDTLHSGIMTFKEHDPEKLSDDVKS